MEKVKRYARMPFFWIGWLIGLYAVGWAVSATTLGEWQEVALQWIGFKNLPDWLPGVLGLAAYFGLGVFGAGYLGWRLLGWTGMCMMPILAIVAISILGRWWK